MSQNPTGPQPESGSGGERPAADPRPATVVMIATYVVGALGIFLGFAELAQDPPTLQWATLLAVGGSGVLSFVRHSLLNRSDAARMGWDFGARNNFQVEVGLANLAWGAVAIAAVVLDWGLAVQAATFLVMGVYLAAVAVMQLVAPGGQRRSLAPLLAIASFGIMLLVLGGWGMSLAT